MQPDARKENDEEDTADRERKHHLAFDKRMLNFFGMPESFWTGAITAKFVPKGFVALGAYPVTWGLLRPIEDCFAAPCADRFHDCRVLPPG